MLTMGFLIYAGEKETKAERDKIFLFIEGNNDFIF